MRSKIKTKSVQSIKSLVHLQRIESGETQGLGKITYTRFSDY
jgi:hypothetical protein